MPKIINFVSKVSKNLVQGNCQKSYAKSKSEPLKDGDISKRAVVNVQLL